MDAIELVPLPEKVGSVIGAAKRLLVGGGHIPPHELEAMRKLVTDTGFAHSNRPPGFVNGVKGLLFGASKDPLGVFKARVRQGGVLGKGGLVRGDIAMDPAMIKTWRKIRGGDHSFGNYSSLAGHGLGQAASVAFGPGLPAAALAGATLGTGTWGDAGAEGASMLGYAMGAPFGMVGGMVGGSLGSYLGDSMRHSEVPLPDIVEHNAVRAAVPATAHSFQRFEAPGPEISLPEVNRSPMIQTTY